MMHSDSPTLEMRPAFSESTIRSINVAERYCSSDIMRFPLGNGEEIIKSRLTGIMFRVPGTVSKLLPLLSVFDTIVGHSESLRKQMKIPDKEMANLRLVLSHLAEAGILIAQSDYACTIDSTKGVLEPPPPIRTIAIPTRDRPDSLRQAVTSYAENCRHYGRKVQMIVADNSERRESRKQIKFVLDELSKEHNLSIKHAGLEEKAKMSARLSKAAQVPLDVLTFGLMGVPGLSRNVGASRNMLLLQTVGEMFASVDDDTVCRVAQAEGARQGLLFHSGADRSDVWFHKNREEAISSSRFEDVDFLSLHERLLGWNINDCVNRCIINTSPEFYQATTSFYRSFIEGNGKVGTTMLGFIGDCGMSVPRWHWLTGESRARSTRSKEAFSSAYSSREITCVVQSDTISAGPCFMTNAVGFDNRNLLPPFFPTQRGSDAIFGTVLRKCFEHSYIGHLPWAVAHLPLEERRFSHDAYLKDARGYGTAGLLNACINSYSFLPGLFNAEDRLRTLGRHLIGLGSMRLRDFGEYLHTMALQQFSEARTQLQNLLQTYDQEPKYWADAISMWIDTFESSLSEYQFTASIDLLEVLPPEEARRVTQGWVRQYGELLLAWPDIVGAAYKVIT